MEEKKIHYLKCHIPFYGLIEDGLKTFDVRKNDRGFKAGDYILFEEFNPQNDRRTGNEIEVFIPYVFYGGAFGLPPELCVIGIEPTNQQEP